MTPADRRPSGRAKNNLVALGTAAVLAVYAAGFERTRAAAQRFAESDAAQRRPAPPSAREGEQFISAPAPRAQQTDSIVARATAPARPARKDSAPAAPSLQTVEKHDTAVVSAPAPASAPATNSEKPAAPATAQTTDTTAKTDSTTQKERGPYKDGTYYGWGTSRHGDIQAGVEITNGRINAAWIQQCLTRYSCSWIAALPGQVEARQSAEVDFVSGATQSTNAFYYGVVQALSKAK